MSAAWPQVVANPKKLIFIFFSILHLRRTAWWTAGPLPTAKTPRSQLSQKVLLSSLERTRGVLLVSRWTE